MKDFYFEYLCPRILSTCSSETKVTPAKLFGINTGSLTDFRLRNMMRSNLGWSSPDHLMLSMKITLPSLNNTEEFSQFIRDLPIELSIGLWKAAEGDPYDCLLMLRLDAYSDPFFFFLELKPPGVWPNDKDGMKMKYKDPIDYVKSQAMIDRVIGSLPGDALLKADGYLYCYFVASGTIESRFYKDSRRMVISGSEANFFLRFFGDFYKALRALALPEDAGEEVLKD